ncbi:hypothetical protein GCM10009530_30320 [Microbispora corallina]|uniref:Uncharacterized protein n=1 Tax=Microbispora corallina TaxID=83302 RepID=A0ABQ4G0Y3_9ACTN|nr:hypothetical protein Mco01_36380 [Microbispora corallina]
MVGRRSEGAPGRVVIRAARIGARQGGGNCRRRSDGLRRGEVNGGLRRGLSGAPAGGGLCGSWVAAGVDRPGPRWKSFHRGPCLYALY